VIRKLLFFLAVLFAANYAAAQGACYPDGAATTVTSTLNNSQVRVISFAGIRVCNEPASGTPCTPLTTIYTTPALTTQLPNPFTADNEGNYRFCVSSPSTVHIQVSGPQVVTQNIPNVTLGIGSSSGGLTPCGVLNDVQLYGAPTTLNCDSTVLIADPAAHSVTDNIVVARQEVDVSDPTHSGLVDFGHSNGTTVDAHFLFGPSSTFNTSGGGYGISPPDHAPTNTGYALTISSLTPVGGLLPTAWTLVGGGVGCTLGGIPLYGVLSNNPDGTCYGDTHFIYDTASYAKRYVLIDLSAGISSGSVTKFDEQFGYGADASSDASTGNTAVGYGTVAIGGGATALGFGATASAVGAIAIGGTAIDALASAEGAIAIGTNAEASGIFNIAIGVGTSTTGTRNSISIGPGIVNDGFDAIAIGDGIQITDTTTAASIVAIGDGVQVYPGGTDSVIIGDGAENKVGSVGYDSCNAIGNGAHCLGSDSAAYGEGAAAAQDSIAIGLSQAPGEDSIAIGDGSGAAGFGSVVIGGMGGTDNGHDDSLLLNYNAGTGATAAHQIWLGSTTETDLYLGNTTGVTIHNAANLSPVLGPAGTLQAAAHSVIGTCAIGSTCTSLTLTGAAIFTSNTSYVCTGVDQTGVHAISISQASGTAFTITGNGTDTVGFLCTGN
jgi:hypothetical protein